MARSEYSYDWQIYSDVCYATEAQKNKVFKFTGYMRVDLSHNDVGNGIPSWPLKSKIG